jgi:D-amino-acid dehydrogenase
MQTLIIGGGLIGLATAQALLERDEHVRVLEAREGVGLETSFANGGMLTPSMPEPWNGPGVHRHLAASLFRGSSSMQLRFRAIPSLISWGVAFLRNSTASRFYARDPVPVSKPATDSRTASDMRVPREARPDVSYARS